MDRELDYEEFMLPPPNCVDLSLYISLSLSLSSPFLKFPLLSHLMQIYGRFRPCLFKETE